MGVPDFDTEVAVVVRDDLEVWQRLNVTAFLMSGVTARAGAEALGELQTVPERAQRRGVELAIYTGDRNTFLVLISVAALLCASMLAPAFGAPQATSAASLAKKLAATLRIAKRADRNAKRAIKGLQVEGKRGPAGPPGATGAQGAAGAKGDQGEPATRLWAVINASG